MMLQRRRQILKVNPYLAPAGAAGATVRTDRRARIGAIPDSGDLQHRFAAYELDLSTNDAVNPWPDEVGEEDLDGAGPSFQSDGINGNPSVRYDAVDGIHQAQTVAAWNFLHDGSPFSAYLVVESFGSGNLRHFCTTQGVLGSDRRGFSFARDDRNDGNELRVSVSNGSGWVLEYQEENEFPGDSPEIYGVTFDGDDQYTILRGKSVISTPTGSGHNTNDAEFPMHRGEPLSDTGAEDPIDSDVGSDLYYHVEHDQSTREDVIDYLADQFNISV